MNYKTTLVLTAIAAAALVASAFPMVGTVFASVPPGQGNQGDENTAIACLFPNEENDCRQQGFQLGRDNEQTNTFED
jgi:hypothetical protein